MQRYVRQVASAVTDLMTRKPRGPLHRGSKAFRRDVDLIWRGQIPSKYTRVLKLVPGDRVLEIGAAEGVLSLLLAGRKQQVIAVEMQLERHKWALQLQARWKARGLDVSRCRMVHGDIRDHLDLLKVVDTLVAVRTIYHLHEDIEAIFAHVGRHVPNVVLCGNQGRARQCRDPDFRPGTKTEHFNAYASAEGMTGLLESCGYGIAQTDIDGDPIVVGVKRIP